MMDTISLSSDIFHHFTHILFEILPVFFIAVLCSSLLDIYLPNNYFEKLARDFPVNLGWKSLFLLSLAAILGAFVPICTCGMIPLAMGLLKKKLNWTYVLVFLFAGNASSISALILNFGILGLNITIWRLIFAVVFAILTVICLYVFFGEEIEAVITRQATLQDEHKHCCGHKISVFQRVLNDLKDAMKQFLPWILFAILIATLLHFNHALLINYLGDLIMNDFLSPLIFSVISFPLYLCAGADIAMSKEFLDLGVALGSVLAFMTASPGVNLTTFMIYKQAFNFKFAVLFSLVPVFVITTLAILFNSLNCPL